jgi:hypothetical protein
MMAIVMRVTLAISHAMFQAISVEAGRVGAMRTMGTTATTTKRARGIYGMGAIKRSGIIWVAFQSALWLVFGVSYLFSADSWSISGGIRQVPPAGGSVLETFLTIVRINSVLFLLITVANLFARFGQITLGPIILLIQAVMIGRVAGTNAFEYPFASALEANIQYLKVGLWETTAYALICAVTMTKSLLVADSFPAKKWVEVKALRDLRFTAIEKALVAASVLLLVAAGLIEAYLIHSLG